MCYEITLEKCICAGRTIVHTVPPRDKKIMIFCKHEHLGEVMVVNDPFWLGCIGSDDCNVYLSNFQLCINCSCLPYLSSVS